MRKKNLEYHGGDKEKWILIKQVQPDDEDNIAFTSIYNANIFRKVLVQIDCKISTTKKTMKNSDVLKFDRDTSKLSRNRYPCIQIRATKLRH